MLPETIATLPLWQREKVMLWQEICEYVDEDIAAKTKKGKAYHNAYACYSGSTLLTEKGEHKTLRISASTVEKKYKAWLDAGKSCICFVDGWSNSKKKVPDALITEMARLRTMPGMGTNTRVIAEIKRRWFDGAVVDGVGDWQSWWMATYPNDPMPGRIPDFPIADRTLQDYFPRNCTVTLGTKGSAAASKELPSLLSNPGKLEPGQVLIFDDVRLDVVCMNSNAPLAMRGTCDMTAYIALDWATRYIPAFSMRSGNAQKKQDVRELIFETLRTIGLCKNHTTHIILERGSLTMTKKEAQTIEQATEGRVKIHFTTMNKRRAWDGAGMESGKGHWMGKAPVESLMRQLHLRLMHLPGQRGNSFDNQPESLGHTGHLNTPTKGTVADEAMKLASIQVHNDHRHKLKLPMLWDYQLNAAFSEAIKEHNEHRGSDYLGHGKITQQWNEQTKRYEDVTA